MMEYVEVNCNSYSAYVVSAKQLGFKQLEAIFLHLYKAFCPFQLDNCVAAMTVAKECPTSYIVLMHYS